MSRRWLATVAALATAVVIGCVGGSPPATDVQGSPVATIGSPALAGTATPIARDTPARSTDRDRPPDATLAVDGGDPVRGELGTYVWREAGADSPWLAGSPVAAAAGEPLTLQLDPAIGIGSWRARYVPADQTDATGARPLGEGTGVPSFQAPAIGRWTVEVHVDLPSGPGSASYFWQLEVT